MNFPRISRLLLAIVFLLLPINAAFAAPTPKAGGTPDDPGKPQEAFIGTTTTMRITFENDSDEVGFGPFLDVFMPSNKGIELTSAAYGTNGPQITHEKISPVIRDGEAWFSHPYRKGSNGEPPLEFKVDGGEDLVLHVLTLPYGSVAGRVHPHEIDLSIKVDQSATLNTPIKYEVYAGFHSDEANFTGGGQYQDTAFVQAVEPILARLEKIVDAPEGETAVGRTFERKYTVSVEIAPGESLSELAITDFLPNNIVVTRVPEGQGWNFEFEGGDGENCQLPNPSGSFENIEAGPCNNWQLIAKAPGNVTGKAHFDFYFYVPFEDADGTPVALGEGSEDVVINTVSGSATWETAPDGVENDVELSPRQHELKISRNVNGGGAGSGNEESGIMMIQKYVETPRTGSWKTGEDDHEQGWATLEGRDQWHNGDVSPGDIVTFRLEFQISDHSAYSDVVITDELGNGLQFDSSSARLELYQHNSHDGSGPLVVEASSDNGLIIEGPTNDGETGTQTIKFRVTQDEGASGPVTPLPNKLLGACIDYPTMLMSVVPENCATSQTRGVLTYKATVLEKYRSPASDRYVVQGDTIENTVSIEGSVLHIVKGPDYLKQTGAKDSDGSSASVTVPRTLIDKSIVAINGDTREGQEGNVLVAAGDTVTFSLKALLPTSDIRDFYLEDELPSPVFAAQEFVHTEPDSVWDQGESAFPSAGKMRFGGATTFPLTNCSESRVEVMDLVDNVEVSGTRNSIKVNLEDFSCSKDENSARNTASVIELLITATVKDVSIADEFLINNRFANGENAVAVATSNQLLTFTRPLLNITKGVIEVGGNSSGTWSADFPTDRKVTSGTNRRDFDEDANLVDAKDKVTFAIIIENEGTGIHGAHGISLTDQIPEGISPDTTSITASLGTGEVLGVSGDLFSNEGITFRKGDQDLVLEPKNESGSNIIVVTYTATVADDIEFWSTLTNTATVKTYYAKDADDAINLADSEHDGPIEDKSQLRVDAPAPTKKLVSTSEEHTQDHDVAIGEIVRYRLAAVIPEGKATDFKLRDELPAGLIFRDDGPVNIAFVSENATGLRSDVLAEGSGSPLYVAGTSGEDVKPTFELPAERISPNESGSSGSFGNGTDIWFDLGTITNDNNNAAREYVVIEFNAQVLNKEGSSGESGSANKASDKPENRVSVYAGGSERPLLTSDPVLVTIVEPSLTVDKLRKRTGPGEGDANSFSAGDEVEYTITVTNTGNATAFDVVVTDVLAEYLEFIEGPTGSDYTEGTRTLKFPNLEKLEHGTNNTETFTFKAKIIPETPTGRTISNTAKATYTSLPNEGSGTKHEGHSFNETGSSTKGEDGAWNGARRNEATGSTSLTTVSVGPTKSVAATSERHTKLASGDIEPVAIGEIVRFALTVSIPEGVTNKLKFSDKMDNRFQLVDATGDDHQVTISAEGENLSFPDLGVNPLEQDVEFPNTKIDTSNDQTITFDIGNVTNTPGKGAGTITIKFNALVRNVSSNKAGGDNLPNSFTVTHQDPHSAEEIVEISSNEVEVRIVEPDIKVKKVVAALEGVGRVDSASGNASGLDIGTIVTYAVTISNEGATAFGTTLTDELPKWLERSGDPKVEPEGLGYEAEFIDSRTLEVTSRDTTPLDNAENGPITVTYSAKVIAEADGEQIKPGEEIINTAIAKATSLPGGGTRENDTGSVTPGAPGENDGARKYSGDQATEDATHVVSMADSAKAVIAKPSVAVTKSLDGESAENHLDGTYTITYDLTVENDGDIDLSAVHLYDDLEAVFGDLIETATVSSSDVDEGDINASYTGAGENTGLFTEDGIALPQGESATVTITVTVKLTDPSQLSHNEDVEYINVATANGTTEGGLETEDVESNKVEVDLLEDAGIAVTKTLVDNIVNHADGWFTITYDITVENTGAVTLTKVSLVDKLIGNYGPDGEIEEVQVTLSNGPSTLVLNTAYNGNGIPEILDEGSTLADGAAETIHLTLRVKPTNSQHEYTNTVTASGTSPVGQKPTATKSYKHPFDVEPAIAIATCLPNGGIREDEKVPGLYHVDLTVLVRNFGNVQLNNVSATLNLEEAFGDAAWFKLNEVTGDFASETYGAPDWELFGEDITLYSAGQATGNNNDGPDRAMFTITVSVVPGSTLAYEVKGSAAGTSPLAPTEGDGRVSAFSVNDCDLFDEDAEDPKPEEPKPTPVLFPSAPLIGVAKAFTGLETVEGEPGTFDITFRFVLRNYGNVPLTAVSLKDEFGPVFVAGGGADWKIRSIVAEAPLVAEDDYEKAASTGELLSSGSRLDTAAMQAEGKGTAEGTVEVTLRVKPEKPSEEFLNTAVASGEDPSGDPVEDPSNDGEDPEPGTNTPTPFTFETPIIGIAKDAPAKFDFGSGLVDNPRHDAAGTYEVGYVLTIVNYGDVPLSDLVVTDALLEQLSNGNPVSARALDGSLTANPAWDGSNDTANILEGGQTLGYDEGELVTETVRIAVTLEPGAALVSGSLQLENQAHAEGTSPGGRTVEDDSNAGTDPDDGQPNDGNTEYNGDEDPTNNDGPTTVTLTESPRIAIAKALEELENLGNGDYGVTFTLNVANVGDVNLTNVQVLDDLSATFRGTPVTVTGLTATAPLTAGDASTAQSSGQLLNASSSTLAVGESATITLQAVVTPGDEIYNGAFLNTAIATGDSPAGREVTDKSNDGHEPKPGEDTPTPIVIIEKPVIGVAKAATTTPVGDGRYDVLLTFTIKNYGDVELRNITLAEDLTGTFGEGASEVLSLHSPTLAVNKIAPDASAPEAFDGHTHQELLMGTDTLKAGQSGVIQLLVRVTPQRMGTHYNQVRVKSVSPGGEEIEDDSTDGYDPDASDEPTNSEGEPTRPGDGNPNEDTPTPITFTENPVIGVSKNATVSPRQDGTFDVLLTFNIRNYGDQPLSGVRLTDSLENIYAITDLTPERVSVESSTLTANPNYDGRSDTEVLAGVDSLAVGEQRSVSVKLAKLTPTTSTRTTNTAVARGESPHGTETSDRSQDGLDPDPDGDGDPTNNDDPTPIVLEVTPEIALAKRAVATLEDDGTYTVTFTLRVKNTGNTPLLGVQVQDDLADYYANTNLTPDNLTVESGDLSVNALYDGRSDPDLLDGTDVLQVGEHGDITLTLTGLTVTRETRNENTALASGTSPQGERVTDKSNDGTDPEPGNDTPTVTVLGPKPLLGLAKSASVSLEENGTYSVTFTITAKNYGNTKLTNVMLQDDLTQFYDHAGLSSGNVSVASSDLPVNAGYDGRADQELLGAGATLEIGETKRLTITLTGLSVSGRTSFTNQALGEGEGPGGEKTPPEKSTDGEDPDPDGDGDPTNNDDPTPVELEAKPLLGVAKKARVSQNDDGSYDITLTFTLSNMGNSALENVQLTDDISELYEGTDLRPANVKVTSSDLPVNPGYDGRANTKLLGAGAALALGQTAHVTLTLKEVTPISQTRYLNSALGEGEAPDGTPTEDNSQDGDDPDPDGDGDPTNNDDPTPIVLEPQPRIGIAKKATLTANDDGSFDLTLDFNIGNYGNTVLEKVQVRDSLRNLYDLTNLAPSMITLTSSDFTVNANYDGNEDQFLLTGEDSLARGGSGTVRMLITGLTVSASVHTTNTAIATGEDPNGNPSPPDRSTDGDDPDPDGDGDPGNNDDPTPIVIPGDALLGLAKSASTTAKSGGAYDITFTLRVVNYGNVPLSNLSITDDLAEFYANTNLTASGVSVSSADLTVNAGYDGNTDQELLAPGNRLGVGGSAELTITLNNVTPNPGVTRLENSAVTTGETPTGGTVTDTSQNGNDPDPDGDGDPTNNNDPTPVTFEEHTGVTLDKSAAPGPYQVGDRIAYTLTLTNPNDVPVSATITDIIPAHTSYIGGSARFEPESAAPAGGSEPRITQDGALTWRSLVLPGAAEIKITYELRVEPGATGELINNATVNGRTMDGSPVSDTASERVRVEAGVFDLTRGLLIGRVYLDVNGDNAYTEGVDVPLKDARVVLSNGWQTLTDEQGNYAFRDLEAGTWTVQVDRLTAQYEPNHHPERLRDQRQHKVHVQGVTVSDFPLEPLAGVTGARRETTLTYGPVTLHKYLLPIDDGVRVVLELSSEGPQPALTITDPVKGGEARVFTVTLDGSERVITYDLPRGAELTDPSIQWSNQ